MGHDASQRKKTFISLKSNTEQCFDSTLYQTIYCCIVIHQRQYIDTSTHCIVATLGCVHTLKFLRTVLCDTTCIYKDCYSSNLKVSVIHERLESI